MLQVQVTAEDVARGQKCHSGACPVALAVARALPGRSVTVTREDVMLDDADGGRRRTVSLPFDVGEAIALFDRTGEMQPMTFNLEVRDDELAER